MRPRRCRSGFPPLPGAACARAAAPRSFATVLRPRLVTGRRRCQQSMTPSRSMLLPGRSPGWSLRVGPSRSGQDSRRAGAAVLTRDGQLGDRVFAVAAGQHDRDRCAFRSGCGADPRGCPSSTPGAARSTRGIQSRRAMPDARPVRTSRLVRMRFAVLLGNHRDRVDGLARIAAVMILAGLAMLISSPNPARWTVRWSDQRLLASSATM